MELLRVLQGIEHQFSEEVSTKISGISYDSRAVQPGDLFVAVSGLEMDGHDFVHEAAQKGACAVLVERELTDLDLPQVVVENTRFALGVVSANFYGHPDQKLRVLGVTGTNGKTTTTYLVKSILEQAGYKVGLIGTIQTLIGDTVFESRRTTPESLDLQRLLHKCLTKEQILQLWKYLPMLWIFIDRCNVCRHTVYQLIPGSSGLSSNNGRLFQSQGQAFADSQCPAAINIDDEWGSRLTDLKRSHVISYAAEQAADFRASNIKLENGGLSYILNTEAGQIPISLRLTGFFNVYNSLGAAALCFSQGVSLENIRDGLEAVIGVPGRFERIENDRGLNIVVDYAHTPGGLENVLQSGRELTPKGRLILVFGAGGDRDRSKRPLMGAVAGRLADLAIITSDNPRSEEPGEICSSIEKGLLKENHQSSYKIIVDRRTAIRRAVELANPDDLVIVAGKGHETYQELAQGRIHFDDREEVRKAIKELKQ